MDLSSKPGMLPADSTLTMPSQAGEESHASASATGKDTMAADGGDVDMKKQQSVMNTTEVNRRRQPSSTDLGLPRDSVSDLEMRLRKYPTLMSGESTSWKGRSSSAMEVERDRSLLTKMSVEPPGLRTNQTVVMADEEQAVADLEMRPVNSTHADTLVSPGNEKSVMETESQAVGSDAEMSSVRQETFNDIEMRIKQEPSEMDSDVIIVKETAGLETDVSIKSEPSFFGDAFDDDDDSSPLVLQEITSEDRMSQSLSSQHIKVEPGVSFVEDYPDCIDTPVPLLRARYTVTSGPAPYAGTSLAYKQKFVVKLKNKISTRYRPYSLNGKRQKANLTGETELMPTCSTDDGEAIKCEPASDIEFDDLTGEESFLNTVKKPPRKRGPRKKNPPVCVQCQQHFCSYSSLKRHYQRKHCVQTLSFSCSFCECKFARVTELRAHERLHRGGDKTFPCQECDVVFTRACHLKVHMRKHTGERPYTCSVTDCRATFRSTSNLNRHMKKHSGLRPYLCTVCDANFYQSSHLVSHVRKHTGERPFKCAQCDATFAQRTHLHRHRIKHTGKKPFVCTTCGMGFVEKYALRKHAQVHVKHLRANRLLKVKLNVTHLTKNRNIKKKRMAVAKDSGAQQSSSAFS
ncbi:hypothetical protein ACOMHN_041197 [Nucella lapillus]